MTATAPDNAQEQQHIIFDPTPRIDEIEPSIDPYPRVPKSTCIAAQAGVWEEQADLCNR